MNRVALVGALAVMATTGTSAQLPRVRRGNGSWVAPQHAAAKMNPLAGRPELAAGGRKIFAERCTMCHGADADGTNRGPSLLGSRVQTQSDGALFWKISSGDTRAGMPSFSFLPPLERWQLVLHLRALARGQATEGGQTLAPALLDGERAPSERIAATRQSPRSIARPAPNRVPTAPVVRKPHAT
jgi:mono/diheme cytochrome c family protein